MSEESWRCTGGGESGVVEVYGWRWARSRGGVRVEVREAGTYCENYGVIPTDRCRANDYGYRSGKKVNYTQIMMLGAGNLGIGGGQ